MNAESIQAPIIDRLRLVLFKEPLVPFALMGALLFVSYEFGKPTSVETIEVTQQSLKALEGFEEQLRGRPLSEEERQTLVERFVEDEVLVREARRRGLERQDSRIRKRLLSVMRSTLDEQVPEPTRVELQAYFRENSDRYAAEKVIRIDHVFFTFGNEPSEPHSLLNELRSAADHRQFGEPFFAGSIYRDLSRQDMLPIFGAELVAQVFGMPINDWRGPLESRHGIHFIRVTKRQALPRPAFDELEEHLRQEWMFNRRLEVQSRKIAEMRKRYRVVFVEGD